MSLKGHAAGDQALTISHATLSLMADKSKSLSLMNQRGLELWQAWRLVL